MESLPLDEIAIRLDRKTHKTDGCWIWTDKPNPRGYGILTVNGKIMMAHRLSWMVNFGEIPEGFFVCHHCDNRLCVRPDHLFIGTPAMNTRDMMRKGRGVSHHKKLTEEQVIEIRKRYEQGGCTYRSLAADFAVSHGLIYQIVHRIQHRDVA